MKTLLFALLGAFLLTASGDAAGFKSKQRKLDPRQLHGKELVDYINQKGKWKAAFHSKFGNATSRELSRLAGVKLDFARVLAVDARRQPRILARKKAGGKAADSPLPRWFDARNGWSYCWKEMAEIQDQSLCGSCWAVSTASSLQDRFCIWSRGRVRPQISSIDLVSCCRQCGEGCTGGYPHRVFEYAQQQGVVSGGNFTNADGCKPYTFAPCGRGGQEFAKQPTCKGAQKEKECVRTCQEGFDFNYYTDLYFTTGGVVIQNDAEEVRRELFRSGPLVFGALQVFEDFLHYKSGIYEVTGGKFIGLHAVRVIGWGEENGVPYWLVANSWSRSWGDGGFFKIRRGNNEANIEGISSAGFPDFRRSAKAFEHL
ncbi:Cathepsin B [Aphelenchoides fujianensis]|nr:Cathepsin B [Aphelenchoides fujianensis]